MYVPLKYTELIGFGLDSITQHEWNANNLIDPNRTGTGHQPMYFDEYVTMYNRWLVSSVSWKMEIVNSATVPLRVCMLPIADLSPFQVMEKGEEQPYAQTRLVGNFGTNKASMSGRVSTKKIRGETVLDDSFSGFGGSIPPERPWYFITLLQSEPVTEAKNCVVRFTFVFNVRFFKRRPAEQS